MQWNLFLFLKKWIRVDISRQTDIYQQLHILFCFLKITQKPFLRHWTRISTQKKNDCRLNFNRNLRFTYKSNIFFLKNLVMNENIWKTMPVLFSFQLNNESHNIGNSRNWRGILLQNIYIKGNTCINVVFL